MSRPVVHSVDSCIAEVVLVQLGHQTHRREDHHFPDRSFTLQHPRCYSLLGTRSCWSHSCILSATFLTAFFFSLSGLVLGVQFLGALRAFLLIEPVSILLFLCAFLSLGPFCCFPQRHINVTSFTASCVGMDLSSVSWFEHEQTTEVYDSRDRSLWPFAARVFQH